MHTWTNRTKNGHLPTKYAWVSYRFKLWPGLRYGLATLATPLAAAKELLRKEEQEMLPFLGINRNIKRGWRTLPRVFGGVGLLSFPVDQMICWLNMLIQHYKVPSTLGHKFRASLEALQLEVGTRGNPLLAPYPVLHVLATPCWFKTLWERLWAYRFQVHLEYPDLELPRENDTMILVILLEAGKRGDELVRLNRCRV